MAQSERSQEGGSVMLLLTAVVAGTIAMLISLLAFGALISDQATRQEELARTITLVYWSQPVVFIMAGLIAGAGDARWGPVRAPIIGVFLAAMCWVMLRRQQLLAPDANIMAYLLPAGAVFGLAGALLASVLRDRVSSAVGAMWVLGVVAFIWAYLNLGSISGVVQREVIQRGQDMTLAMDTVRVPDAPAALLQPGQGDVLYETKSSGNGRFHFRGVPLGEYTLAVRDPIDGSTVTEKVEAERAITGGTRWRQIALKAQVRESGRIFE